MNREVILVEVVNCLRNDLSTTDSRTFTNTKKAEDYFTKIVKDDFKITNEEIIESALDDGFLDKEVWEYGELVSKSIIIKEITLEDD